MHSCDNDSPLAVHDGRERFGTPHRRLARLTRAHENWIVGLNRGGKNNQAGVAGILRAMLLMKTQTEPLQSIGLYGSAFVGATDFVAEVE